MLSQLTTVKLRLAIGEFDVQYDTLLTNALNALSARFDKDTNRTLTRTPNSLHDFRGDDNEIVPPCVPIDNISKFELKSNETEGWVQQNSVEYVLRNGCAISLADRLGSWRQQGRITYTGRFG